MALEGTWYNGIGSELRLDTEGDMIYGRYITRAGGTVGEYKVTGRYNRDPARGGMAVGFVVVWNNGYSNSHSVTSWSGQYQEIDGREEIVTMWLLTQVTPDVGDWHTNLVGHDVFQRQRPSEEEISKRSKHGPRSHPEMR